LHPLAERKEKEEEKEEEKGIGVDLGLHVLLGAAVSRHGDPRIHGNEHGLIDIDLYRWLVLTTSSTSSTISPTYLAYIG
jgi:hypothetical protein